MKQSDNPTALRTQRLCREAFMKLYTGDNYPLITIKMICLEAGITRQAFYQNFDNKEDVVYSILKEVLDSFTEQVSRSPYREEKEFFTHIFEFWQNHPKLFSLCLDEHFSCYLIDVFTEYLMTVQDYLPYSPIRRSEPKYRPFMCRMYIAAFSEAMRCWASEQYREHTPEQMTVLVSMMFNAKLPLTDRIIKRTIAASEM